MKMNHHLNIIDILRVSFVFKSILKAGLEEFP